MRQLYIERFSESTLSVFDTMVGKKATLGDVTDCKMGKCEADLNAIISLTGDIHGNVIFGVNRGLALLFTEMLLGETPESINEDVIDATGEMANMVIGASKSSLGLPNLSMSVPSIICGSGAGIGFPSELSVLRMPFQCETHEFTLQVCISEPDDAAKEKYFPTVHQNDQGDLSPVLTPE